MAAHEYNGIGGGHITACENFPQCITKALFFFFLCHVSPLGAGFSVSRHRI